MMARRTRISLLVAGIVAGLGLLAILAALLLLPSRWFHDRVRDRLVYEVERSTGGRAEIGSFDFDWRTMRVRVAPFVLHGTEASGEAPLLRADSIEAGLKILSIVRRDINIASLRVDKPRVNLLMDAQGHTNLPNPKVPSTGDPVQKILDLAVRDFVVAGGEVHFADRRVPLDLQGQDVEVHMTFDRRGPKYAGTVGAGQLHVDAPPVKPLTVALASQLQFERNTLTVDSARLSMTRSSVTLSGRLDDYRNPRIQFKFDSTGDLAELGDAFGMPSPRVGTVSLAGAGTYADGAVQLDGKVSGRGLGVDQGRFRVRNVSVDGSVRLANGSLSFTDVRAGALGGRFAGSVSLADNFRELTVQGALSGLTLRALAAAEGLQNPVWDGTFSGPVGLTASLGRREPDVQAHGTLDIKPVPGAQPFEGKLELAYDQQRGTLQLGQSYIATAATRASFSGTFGEHLQFDARTHDLNDLLPAIAMISPGEPQPQIPVRISPGGEVAFSGTASGPPNRMQISGHLRAAKLTVQDHTIDAFSTNLRASASGLHLEGLDASAPEGKISGSLNLGLDGWKLADSNSLAGKVRLQASSLAALAAGVGVKDVELEGSLLADMDLKGTVADPAATGQVIINNPSIYGEKFDRLQADFRHTGAGVDVVEGQLESGGGRLSLAATLTHPVKDFRNGTVAFDLSTRNVSLSRFKVLNDLRPGTNGRLEVSLKGVAAIRDAQPSLQKVAGQIALRDLVTDGHALGELSADLATRGDTVNFTAKGTLRGSQIQGKGTLGLTGDYQAQGDIEFTPTAISVLADVAMPNRSNEPLPFDGVVAGKVTFSGLARHPDQMTAHIELPTLELVPSRPARNRDKQRDIAMRNQGPVIIERDAKGVQVRSARFVGTDTNLTLSGTINLSAKNPWNLNVNGSVNLGVLEEFAPDMVTSGTASVNATVRGTLERPQLIGRFELKGASLYLADLPNGLDQANGVVIFDANRATIEKLTAVSGGGRITLSGYVVYNSGEPAFRLQARADGVRIRYPEGVSTSSNAVLSLNGSKSQSVLSGTITVLRASFNPQTDVASLIAGSGKPIETPAAPNPYLRDMHLDVRVETVPNLGLQTSLSRNLQAQADLRVRGTAAKPAVLGHITVTQGEIEFFGNKYTINRGEIDFYNLARIEPVLAMDLETKVRGVDVNISFSGTLPNKLNFSYRSDPPLQSNEIIALLAMGRDPTRYGGLGSAQSMTSSSPAAGLTSSGGSLLGSALAAPVSDRLQRFFGVSRLKLDPSLTNLTGSQTAVSRLGLTVEQQVSRDITVTYVANLTDANQQIIRVQWDLSRTWSVVALREENGLFGVNFQFRKRFK
jgi:translocation and assembly module TamB